MISADTPIKVTVKKKPTSGSYTILSYLALFEDQILSEWDKSLQASRTPPNASLWSPVERQVLLIGLINPSEISKIFEKKVRVPGDLGKKEGSRS